MAYNHDDQRPRSRHEAPAMPEQANVHPHHYHEPQNRIQRNENSCLLWLERHLPCTYMNPLELLNIVGPLYVIFVMAALFTANAWFTCPKLYGQETCDSFYIPLGYLVMGQVVANYACFRYYSRRNKISNIIPGKLSGAEDNETASYTKFCVPCNEVVPLKSHHCPFCKYCILRKDHHCVILNGCVGFGNQRYFITFLWWTSIGAAFGTVLTWRYLNQFYNPFFPWGWLDYIAPVALQKFVFAQHCTLLDLALCLLFSFGFASIFASLGFCLTQLYFVMTGTTMYETGKRMSEKDYVAPTTMNHEVDGYMARLRATFGDFWLLNFLIPCVWWPNQLPKSYQLKLQNYYLKEM